MTPTDARVFPFEPGDWVSTVGTANGSAGRAPPAAAPEHLNRPCSAEGWAQGAEPHFPIRPAGVSPPPPLDNAYVGTPLDKWTQLSN